MFVHLLTDKSLNIHKRELYIHFNVDESIKSNSKALKLKIYVRTICDNEDLNIWANERKENWRN